MVDAHHAEPFHISYKLLRALLQLILTIVHRLVLRLIH